MFVVFSSLLLNFWIFLVKPNSLWRNQFPWIIRSEFHSNCKIYFYRPSDWSDGKYNNQNNISVKVSRFFTIFPSLLATTATTEPTSPSKAAPTRRTPQTGFCHQMVRLTWVSSPSLLISIAHSPSPRYATSATSLSKLSICATHGRPRLWPSSIGCWVGPTESLSLTHLLIFDKFNTFTLI